MPLASAEAIRAEGEAMQHCVLSRLPDVARGRVALFHATYAGAPLTFEVARGSRNWILTQAKGHANRPLTLAERTALGHWLTAWHRGSAQGGE